MPPEKSKRKTPAAAPARTDRFAATLEHNATRIALVLILLASIRIAATYTIFSHTTDEPAHLACGMEWLDRGEYKMEAQHPPLARIAVALGPYLLGRHFHFPQSRGERLFISGMDTYYEGNEYDLTLAMARFGVLPFFWIAAFVVYFWAKRDFGATTAVTALFLFTFLPPVLAHAALGTTDMALTAFLGAAFLAGRLWLERPTPKSGALFGACGALAILSKFSSLAYFPAAAALALVFYAVAGKFQFNARALKNRLPSLGVAVAVALAIIWTLYRFSFGKWEGFSSVSLPAPELYKGIREVIAHNREGHLSYMLGQVSRDGFRGFYFVVLAFKTPLAFLALAGAGIAIAVRKWRDDAAWLLPLAYAGGVVAVSFFSRINIGVRHILPIYTALAILAAAGLLRLAENAGRRKWAAAATAILLGWYTLSSLASHPDYLPYFNELAGGHPERILVDSDLDWGQDMKRLAQRVRAGGARLLTLGVNTRVHEKSGLPPLRAVNPETPMAGWTAIGFTAWKELRLGLQENQPGKVLWPERYPPQEIVGKSIALWYFPPSSGLPLE